MAQTTELAKAREQIGIATYLTRDAAKNQINSIVGGKDGARFISSIVSAVKANAELQKCDNGSIVSAALLGHSLNLSPSPQLGQYYMVPYNDNKRGMKIAQFQMGYKGYVQLAKRSGAYKKLNVLPIKEGELKFFNPLEEEIEVQLIEDDEIRENAPTIGYYAMFEELNGFRKAIYWSKKKMLSHAERYSAAFSKNGGGKSLELLEQGKIPEKDMWKYSSFWFKNFDAMACKTMLRQLISKWGTMSIEFRDAYESDMAVINADGTKEYVDNESEIAYSEESEVRDVFEKEGDADAEKKEEPTAGTDGK